MTRHSVEDYFRQCAEAFTHADVAAVGRLWLLPAFITIPDQNACFTDVAAFERNTKALCDFSIDN